MLPGSLLKVALSIAVSGLAAAVWTEPAVAAAPAQPAWGPEVNLTRPAPSTYGPDVAVAPDGTALAVWTHGERARSRVMAAWRSPSGSWGQPRRVPGTGGATEAQIAFDGDGELVLAWSAARVVKAVRRPAGGTWADPVKLHRTAAGVRGTRPASLELAVNRHGRAVVSWATLDDDRDATYARSRVQVAVGGAAGGWSRARTLSSARHDAYGAEVAVSGAGRVTVVWDETVGNRGQIMTASRARGQPWSSSRPLSRRLSHPADPQLAALPSGELAVAWNRDGSRTAGIRLRRWSPTDGWGRAVAVPGVKADAWWLDLGIGGAGTVTLAWSNQPGAVWSAEQTSAGAWTRTRVAPRGSVYYGLHLLTNQAGDAVIGWDGNAVGDHHVVRAAYRPRAGSWQAATLSNPWGDAGGVAVALGNDGRVTAAWLYARDFRSDNRVQARSSG